MKSKIDLGSKSAFKFVDNIATGLLCCCGGDFLLHMEGHPKFGGEPWFLIGLVIFLIGHIFIILAINRK